MSESVSEDAAVLQGGQARIGLDSVAVEFLRHADNWLFVAPCAAIAFWLVWSGLVPADAAWFVGGWLIFIPQEYFTHVYVLHAKPPKNEMLYMFWYRLHYGHHDFPKRHDLMYMPLWLSLPMTFANMAFLWAVTPDPRSFLASFCGALFGYIMFEWSHLLCHVPYTPKSGVGRHMRTQHLRHHFFNEKFWYAVTPSTMFMDRLLRSAGKPGELERSEDCRYLGLPSGHEWIGKARTRFAARSSGDLSRSRLWLLSGRGRS